jgi:hypothetical protein
MSSAPAPLPQFIPFARCLATTPLHNLIERFEIRPRLPVLEVRGRLQRRHFLRHRHRYELVYARSVFFAQPLDRLLERSWQPQRIGFGLSHRRILRIVQFFARVVGQAILPAAAFQAALFVEYALACS